MRNAVLGFSLVALFATLSIIIGHIVGVIGLVGEQASFKDFYLATPISLALIAANIFTVIGLHKRKLWAYIFAAVELVAIFINSLISLQDQGLGAIVIGCVAIAILFSLYLDFKARPDADPVNS